MQTVDRSKARLEATPDAEPNAWVPIVKDDGTPLVVYIDKNRDEVFGCIAAMLDRDPHWGSFAFRLVYEDGSIEFIGKALSFPDLMSRAVERALLLASDPSYGLHSS